MNRTTRTLVVSPDAPDPDAIAYAAEVLRRGGLVAFATETVYGLGADARSANAVRAIYEAKGRPSTNPLIVHADSLESARPIAGTWPASAEALALAFWPGPLTLVLPRGPGLPDAVTGGGPTVALRVPRPRVARDLLAALGRPVAAPSANRSLRVSPTAARHVLKDLDGRIDLVLDSGPTSIGLESTVLDLSGQTPTILRPGTILAADLAPILGISPSTLARVDPDGPPKSPGQAAVHYAPKTPTRTLACDDLARYPRPESAGLLLLGVAAPRSAHGFAHRIELLTADFAAPAFYDALHRLDDLGLDVILVVRPPSTPAWAAIADRVARASIPLEPGEIADRQN